MYDWDEITGNSSNSIGYVNFVDEKHEFVSTHYIVNGIPVVKVSLRKSADATLEWLYEYLYKLYKEPLYSSESEVQAQYGKLFTDIDKREIYNIFGKQTAHALHLFIGIIPKKILRNITSRLNL